MNIDSFWCASKMFPVNYFSWIYSIFSWLLIRHLFGWEWLLAHPSKPHLLCPCRHKMSLVILFFSREYDKQRTNPACRVVKPAEGELKNLQLQHEEFSFWISTWHSKLNVFISVVSDILMTLPIAPTILWHGRSQRNHQFIGSYFKNTIYAAQFVWSKAITSC